MVVTVMDVNEESITIDGNHPLAGVNLNFEVEILALRDAVEEEIQHGHIHGPEGHDH